MNFDNAIEQIKAATDDLKADNDRAEQKAAALARMTKAAEGRKRRHAELKAYINAISETANSLRETRTIYY